MADRPLPNVDELLSAEFTPAQAQTTAGATARPLPNVDALLTTPFGSAAAPESSDAVQLSGAPSAEPAAKPGILASIWETMKPSTENRRQEYEDLPDWIRMPEFGPIASTRAFLGTMATGPEETKKIMEDQFPGLKGNIKVDGRYMIMKSPTDGKEYAFKPGLRWSDLLRAAAAAAPAALLAPLAAAGVTGGVAAGALGAAGNELAQVAAGGDFNPEQVAIGGLIGGAVPGAKAARRFLTGETAAAEAAASAAASGAGQTFEEGAATLGRASQGDPGAKAAARGFLGIDQGVVNAADEIGAGRFVRARPEVAAGNPVAREVIKSAQSTSAGKIAREIADENTRGFVQHVRGLFSEWGAQMQRGVSDLSLRGRLDAGAKMLRAKVKQAFEVVKRGMPDEAPAMAPNALEFLKERVKNVSADSPLAAIERTIIGEIENGPTAGGLELLRDNLKAAAKGKGPLAGIDPGVAKKIEGKIADDLLETAAVYGQKENLLAARELSKQEGTLKRGFTALFGKQAEKVVEGSMASKGVAAVNAAAAGDTSKLVKIYESIPPSLRSEVVLDSFGQILQKTGDLKTFVAVFDAIDANPQLRNLVGSSLRTEARQGLANVVTVARGFDRAASAAASTGRFEAALPSVKPGVRQVLSAKVADFSKGYAGKPLETDKLKLVSQFLVDEASSLLEGRTPTPNLFRRLVDASKVPASEHAQWFKMSTLGAPPPVAPSREKETR